MQEAERRRLAPARRHEPLLERDQAQVPQHPVSGQWWGRKGVSEGRGGANQHSALCLCEGRDDAPLLSAGGLLSDNTLPFDCYIFQLSLQSTDPLLMLHG